MYVDVYYQKCTEMYTANNVHRCILQKMYVDVLYQECTWGVIKNERRYLLLLTKTFYYSEQRNGHE